MSSIWSRTWHSFHVRIAFTCSATLLCVLVLSGAFAKQQLYSRENSLLASRLCMEGKRLAEADRVSANLLTDIGRKLKVTQRDDLLYARTSETSDWPTLPLAWEAQTFALPKSCDAATFTWSGRAWLAVRYHGDGMPRLAVALDAAHSDLRTIVHDVLGMSALLALALSAGASWWLSSRIVQPVNALRESMRGVRAGNLSHRITSSSNTREFEDLVDSYNAMLARLEANFEQALRFSGDAAHELRTPLTTLQIQLERLRRDAADGALTEAAGAMLFEVGRLTAITRKLLLLARADGGQLGLDVQRLSLTTLLQTLADDAELIGPERGPWQGHIAPDLHVAGDRDLMNQMLNNLIGNAYKYALPGRALTVDAWQDRNEVHVRIQNPCEALDASVRAHFFTRFFRVRTTSAAAIDGSGLGLCLARALAEAHGGRLILEPGPTEVFSLLLSLPAS